MAIDKPSAESQKSSPAVADKALPHPLDSKQGRAKYRAFRAAKNKLLKQIGINSYSESDSSYSESAEEEDITSAKESEGDQHAAHRTSLEEQSGGEHSRAKQPSGSVSQQGSTVGLSRGSGGPEPIPSKPYTGRAQGNLVVCFVYVGKDAKLKDTASGIRRLKAGINIVTVNETSAEKAFAASGN